MPVGIIMDFQGATLEQYDQVLEKMGLATGGPVPPEGLFHWVTKTDGGIRVTDVWHSREAFDRFAEEHIGPITQEVGFPGPPTMTYFDVHSYLIAG